MAKIPKNLQNDKFSKYLSQEDLIQVSQGKVRNTWHLEDGQLLVVATDRISIFDFVLNALIPKKGEVLTALTHFWLTKVLSRFDHHLVPSQINPAFNAAYDLREFAFDGLEIERCLVVKNMVGKLYPFEMIYRHHIGGSVYKSYLKTGMAGGQQLPPDLPKWSKLDKPIFTPSTKEDVGHDVNIDADYFFTEMAKKGLESEARSVVAVLSDAYAWAYTYAKSKGILILDTKFEVAGLKIVDEILTPDSSRFTLEEDWEKAMKEGRDPIFLDKQPVRDWGATIVTPFLDENEKPIIGINKLNPKNLYHVEFVHSLEVPEEIINDTTARYLAISQMLTGQSLGEYQAKEMGV